ncbi:IS21 family transposase [Clostridium sp. PL3]|uniref:IS21 family transposase n=1 Tax=Clostridium thailandense TaxID=2794346 RepID=A0A949TZ19_9CLOT|nr:IS21 family transposase [Clostridium thailandense]MBV7274426.1 IS21 family transposase [Clostridium thailandense]
MRKDVHNRLKKYTREEQCLLNKSELARRFNCDPRTIDRYLKISSGELEPKKSSRVYKSLIDEYKSIIFDKVDTYGATAMAVYKFIEKKGYRGKYSTVAAFINKHKCTEIQKATIRFETTPGLQAQVDWKENLTMLSKHGEIFKVNIFLMVLGYSRIKYVQLTTDKEQKTLFKCMIDGFRYFGGIPQEILFDNMKTVVDRSKSTFSSIEFNKTFKYFADDAGFIPIACRPYRPQTKGKVESLSRLINRLAVYNGEFEDYDDLDKIVQNFMEEVNNEVSQAINEPPLSRLDKELEYLKPLPSLDTLISYVSCEKEYKVSRESMVNYKGKKYSVPTKYIGLKVNITETCDGNISIYYNQDFIVCHSLSEKKYNYKIGHMHEILKSDACKHLTDMKIDEFIKENMSMMDILLGE